MSGMCFVVRRQTLAWLAAGLLAASLSPAYGQVNNKAYADYFLVGQFGEGKLRIYRNTGTNQKPDYAAHTFLEAGGKVATTPAG